MSKPTPAPKKGPWTSAATPPTIIGWYEVKGPKLFDGRIVWRFWNGSGWEWCFPRGGRDEDTPRRATLLTAAHSWRGVL